MTSECQLMGITYMQEFLSSNFWQHIQDTLIGTVSEMELGARDTLGQPVEDLLLVKLS